MRSQHPHTGPTGRITGWDRLAIIGLGAAGAALSFDALRQMAAAIHVRPELVWLFPLVIDGFIAYGVRALVVLRNASFTARLYVWTLFSVATATSIWANALHAVRINQQHSDGAGQLRLDHLTVGILSTVAPLALAGAVHLYILIARATGPNRGPRTAGPVDPSAPAVRERPADPAHRWTADQQRSAVQKTVPAAPSWPSAPPAPVRTAGADGADRSPAVRPVNGTVRTPDRPSADGPAATALRPATTRPRTSTSTGTDRPGPQRTDTGPAWTGGADRSGHAELQRVAEIAREAARKEGRVSRNIVRKALRRHGLSISNQALGSVLRTVRDGAPLPAAQPSPQEEP